MYVVASEFILPLRRVHALFDTCRAFGSLKSSLPSNIIEPSRPHSRPCCTYFMWRSGDKKYFSELYGIIAAASNTITVVLKIKEEKGGFVRPCTPQKSYNSSSTVARFNGTEERRRKLPKQHAHDDTSHTQTHGALSLSLSTHAHLSLYSLARGMR